MSPIRLPFRRRSPEPPGMPCRELVELVTDYLEGALSEVDRKRFEHHLSLCDDCTTYVEQLRETLSLLGSITPESLSPQAEAELRQAFRDWHTG